MHLISSFNVVWKYPAGRDDATVVHDINTEQIKFHCSSIILYDELKNKMNSVIFFLLKRINVFIDTVLYLTENMFGLASVNIGSDLCDALTGKSLKNIGF